MNEKTNVAIGSLHEKIPLAIVLPDDSETQRKMNQRQLSIILGDRYNINFISAIDGINALQTIQNIIDRGNVNIMLVSDHDMNTPGTTKGYTDVEKSGSTLCTNLRNQGINIPFVGITADEPRNFLDCGANAAYHKDIFKPASKNQEIRSVILTLAEEALNHDVSRRNSLNDFKEESGSRSRSNSITSALENTKSVSRPGSGSSRKRTNTPTVPLLNMSHVLDSNSPRLTNIDLTALANELPTLPWTERRPSSAGSLSSRAPKGSPRSRSNSKGF